MVVFPPLVVFISGKTWGKIHFKSPARGTWPIITASPLFLMEGEGVTAKAPATTADAADVHETEGGLGVETSDARAEVTARTARRGEEGSLSRMFFFLGQPEGVGVAVGVTAAAGERRRFWESAVAKAAAADWRSRNDVDGSRARTSP